MNIFDSRSRFERIVALALLLLALLTPAVARALELTNAGPVTYTRNTAKPFTEALEFPALTGQGTLHITGASSPNAVVRLNGQPIGLPQPPKHGPDPFTIAVTLAEANTLEVTLYGKPGSSLTVRVTQDVDADGAAVVGPAGGTMVVGAGSFAGAEVRIPAGALTSPVVIRARAVPDPLDAENEGPALELLPHGLKFSMPTMVLLPTERPDAGTIQYSSLGAPAWLSLGHNECEAGRLCAQLQSFSFLRIFYARLCRWVDGNQAEWKCKWAFSAQPSDWEGVASKYWPVLLVHGIQPFEFAFDPLDFDRRSPLGGFCGQAGLAAWESFPVRLHEHPLDHHEQGLDVWRFDYDHEGGIAAAALILSMAIDTVQASTGTDQTTIVSHSMGGLVARHYLAHGDGARKTSRLVTLGTPHLGSWWAAGAATLPGCALAGAQMTPGSAFLEALNAEGPQTLRGPTPQYVFVAGQDRRRADSDSCHAYDDDGIVTVESAHAWRLGNPPSDVYPDKATRIGLLGYTHATAPVDVRGWLAPDACGDKGMTEPQENDNNHAVVQEVLKWVRIGPPPPTQFEVLLLGGASHGVILDDSGNERGRLDIPQGNGVFPASLSDDGTRLAYVAGTSNGGGWLRVYEMATGQWHDVFHRYWLQTLKWLPGSNSEVVFWDDVTQTMRLVDVDTGQQRAWQSQWVNGRAYRGGIDWDDASQTAVFEVGCPGAGGDGVYQAALCNLADPAALNHLCDVQLIDLPGGGSCSWATIAARPFITPDGSETYFFARSAWSHAELVRFNLHTRIRTSLRQWEDSEGTVLDLYGNSTVFLRAVSQKAIGQRALWSCPVGADAVECKELRTAPVGDFDVIVVARSIKP